MIFESFHKINDSFAYNSFSEVLVLVTIVMLRDILANNHSFKSNSLKGRLSMTN